MHTFWSGILIANSAYREFNNIHSDCEIISAFSISQSGYDSHNNNFNCNFLIETQLHFHFQYECRTLRIRFVSRYAVISVCTQIHSSKTQNKRIVLGENNDLLLDPLRRLWAFNVMSHGDCRVWFYSGKVVSACVHHISPDTQPFISSLRKTLISAVCPITSLFMAETLIIGQLISLPIQFSHLYCSLGMYLFVSPCLFLTL